MARRPTDLYCKVKTELPPGAYPGVLCRGSDFCADIYVAAESCTETKYFKRIGRRKRAVTVNVGEPCGFFTKFAQTCAYTQDIQRVGGSDLIVAETVIAAASKTANSFLFIKNPPQNFEILQNISASVYIDTSTRKKVLNFPKNF